MQKELKEEIYMGGKSFWRKRKIIETNSKIKSVKYTWRDGMKY